MGSHRTGTCLLLAAAAIAALATLPQGARAQSSSEPDARCELLLQQAVAQLAAEQYARMLTLAEDRMLLCPGPVSSFLLGLSQANMVDSLVVADPAQRQQMRAAALRNLRVAVAGQGGLNARWQYTAHEWIVHLQSLGDPIPAEPQPSEGFVVYGAELDDDGELLEVPPAPPPQPQPRFPWGPVLTGTAGLAALTTGIVMGVSADDKAEEAEAGARQLLQAAQTDDVSEPQLAQWARQTRKLGDEAASDRAWAHGLMIGGGAGLLLAGAWYFLMPPDGKWRWAATPLGAQTTVRF